ncbi:MAG TPA: xanthine dehydrogenase family protein molybdopterin-binding subunit [Chloroflexota bacterium]|nr:xanthine dehydrogenase family protein molybdopterin-binding subunit [Chloroflexota bacterium]
MTIPHLVGRDTHRLEIASKLTGEVDFTDNLELPGMLHGMLLRSTVAHGRVIRVDTSRARELPGVYAVLSGADLVNMPIDPFTGPAFKDQAPLAIDRVRYAGDPLAAVAAVDRDTAEEALGLIEVEIEELPAVLNVDEALAPGAPLIHERLIPARTFADLIEVIGGEDVPATSNACFHYKLRRGDLDQGFRQSARIFEHAFSNPATQHADLEFHCSVAQWVGTDYLKIWDTTQSPSYVRIMLANMFKLPESHVRVMVPYLGAGFGSKLYMKYEPIAALLAKAAGRPVKVRMTRREEFLTITKHGLTAKLRTGVSAEGKILARDCQIFWDTGAYADVGPRVTHKSGYTSAGPYDIPNVRIDSYSVYTNKPPAGAFRGFGIMQVCWAYESQMDIIAREMGWDPVEFRLKNILRHGDVQATGSVMTHVDIAGCVEQAADALHMRGGPVKQPDEPHLKRGRGIACGLKAVITPSASVAAVQMHADGSVTILTSAVDMGQGSDTLLSQIVADELGLPLEACSVTHPDTDATPYDLITAGSRTTFHMGRAVQLAAIEVREQLWPLAAELLGGPPEELIARDGRIWSSVNPEQAISHAQLMFGRFNARAGTVVGRGTFETYHSATDHETGQSDNVTAHWMCGATAVEVEVDVETGKVRVIDVAAAVDAGKAINPASAATQITGATLQGMGPALMEQMILSDGQIANPSFVDYKIPAFADVPERTMPLIVECPHPDGPFGAKGIGESAIFSIAPAIGNAVADAVGSRVLHLPITPEKVLESMEQ